MQKRRALLLLLSFFLILQPQPQLSAAQSSKMNPVDLDGFPRDLPVQGRTCGQEGKKVSTWGIPLVCKKYNEDKIWFRADGKNTAYNPLGYPCPASNQWLRLDQYKYPCVKQNGKLVWGNATYLDAGIKYKQLPGVPKQPAIYAITEQQQSVKDPRTGRAISEQIVTYVDVLNLIEKDIAKRCSTSESLDYCGIDVAKKKQIEFNQSKTYLVSNGFRIFYWPSPSKSIMSTIGIWTRSDGADKTESPAGAPCSYEEMNRPEDKQVKDIREMPYVRYEEKIYTCITSDKGRIFDQGVQISEYKLDQNLAKIRFGNGNNAVELFDLFTKDIEKSGYNSSINGIAGNRCRPWWGEKELTIFGVSMKCVVFDPKEIPQRSQMIELWDLNSDAIYCVIDKSFIQGSKPVPRGLREIVLVTESCQRMIVEKRLV